jgi:hypothetical protein
MTICAGRQLVLPLQLELMHKDGPFPAHHAVVADLALGGEPGRHMVGLFGRSIVIFMARVTFDRRLPHPLISVALSAILHPVRAFELEPGHSGMVPFGGGNVLPGLGNMAIPTMETELKPVAVILTAHPVTGLTGSWGPLKSAFEMTLPAGHGQVSSNEGKIGPVVARGRPAGLLLPGSPAIQHHNQTKAQAKDDA